MPLRAPAKAADSEAFNTRLVPTATRPIPTPTASRCARLRSCWPPRLRQTLSPSIESSASVAAFRSCVASSATGGAALGPGRSSSGRRCRPRGPGYFFGHAFSSTVNVPCVGVEREAATLCSTQVGESHECHNLGPFSTLLPEKRKPRGTVICITFSAAAIFDKSIPG